MTQKLWQDPAYRALSPGAQMEVAARYVWPELQADPKFRGLSFEAQELIKKRYAIEAVTFEDNLGIGDQMKALMRQRLTDRTVGSELAKIGTVGAFSIVQNSGIASALASIAEPEGAAIARRRTLDFIRAASELTGDSNSTETVGSLIGNLADIFAVNAVMGPVTGAARAAVSTAARGGAAVVKAAGSLAKAPLMKPALEILGGAAAEAAVEAIPYFLIEEQRRRANGQEGVLEQGPLEVAKVLGINAAADFAVGSILQAGLIKGAKFLFGPSDVYEAAFKGEKEWKKLQSQIRVGRTSPEALARMSPIEVDAYKQRVAIDSFLREGIADPQAARWPKTSYLAHDMGVIVGRADDGSYRLWEMPKKGAPTGKSYQNITDLENALTYKAYSAYLKLPDEMKDNFLSAHSEWALKRGKALYDQQSLLGSKEILKADAFLADAKEASTKVRPILARPVATPSEVQALSRLDGPDIAVVQTRLPLKGSIVENINSGEVNFLKGSPSVRVAVSDAPNAVFIGRYAAPPEAYEAATSVAERVVKADPNITLEAARASELLDQGFDFFRHADGTVEFFAPRNMKLIGEVSDVLKKYQNPVAVGPVGAQAIVTEQRKFLQGAPGLTRNEGLLMGAAQRAMVSGDPEELRNFGKLYLSSRGHPKVASTGQPIDVRVKVQKGLKEPLVQRSFDALEISVPASVKTPAQQRRYIAGLLEGLDRATRLDAPSRSADYWASQFTKKVQAFQTPYGIDKDAWIADIAEHYGGTLSTVDGAKILRLPSGAEFTGSSDEMLTRLTRRLADQNVVANDLRSQGVRLIQNADGFQARSIRTKSIIAEGKDLPELLDAIDYIPQKLDSTYGPKVVRITDQGFEMEIAGNRIFQSREDAAKFLSQFQDGRGIAYERAIVQSPKGEVSILGDGTYKITLPEYGVMKHFDSLGEARSFLARSDNPDFTDLQDIARLKSADVTFRNGDYLVHVGPNRYVAKDLDELKAILRDKVPDPSDGAPNILDALDPSIEASVPDLVNTWKGARSKPKVGPNPYNLPPEVPFDAAKAPATVWENLRAMNANFTSWIEGYIERTGNKALGRAFADFRDGMRSVSMNTVQDNRTLDTIFRGANGRLLKKDQRIKIFYHLGATGLEDAQALGQQYMTRYGKALKPLTPEEEAVASKVRTFLDDMGKRFGIRFKDLITDYMPRLRDMYDSANLDLLRRVQTADELVAVLPNAKPPKDLKFWAENARVDDVARFFLKDDALEVLMMYAAQGNKKLYLSQPWKQLHQVAEATKLPAEISARINLYRENIMSSYHSNAERNLEAIGVSFARSLKDGPLGKLIPLSLREMEDLGRNAYKSVLSMTYFASMGWKPFLAIRNSMQPWTMAAPRLGLDWVSKAYKEVLDNPKPIAERLRKIGVLTEKPPIVNQVFGHETLAGRALEKSMEWFKNSDDLTRMVAYRASELKFDNAVRAWDMGLVKTPESFFEMAGLDVIDPTTRQQVWELFSSAGNDTLKRNSARDAFAFKMQRDTMFDYSGSDTPGMFQEGIMGKLFGQFGTYSAGYRANMANMFKYGSPKKRAEMVATYLATTTALWAGFNALRIKTNDFTPGVGAIFTGGPMFDIALDGVKAMDPGYEGAQARARLKDQIPRMLPGSAQVLGIQRALEYQSQGDTYAALLSLMATPVTPSY